MSEKIVGKIFIESREASDVRTLDAPSSNVVRMEVVLQDADKENRNKRVYPKTAIEAALRHPFIKEKLETNSLAGEMNHPDPRLGLQRQMTIDLSNVSHMIKKVWWEDKELIGEVETTANRVGKDFAAMIIENNMVPSFSMRGTGDVKVVRGKSIVGGNLRIITWDGVHYPSHKSAYMRALREDATTDVTLSMINEYIAEKSENVGIMTEAIMEELDCFPSLSYKVDKSGNMVITEATTGKPLGVSYLEKKLHDEYKNALRGIL